MSFFQALTDFAYGPGYSHSDFMMAGANYTWGGLLEETPVGQPGVGHRGAGGYTRVRAFTGGVYSIHHQRGSTAGGYTAASPDYWKNLDGFSKFATVFGIGTTLALTGAGFYYGGLSGGIENIIHDVAVGGALARYGHSMADITGTGTRVAVYGNLGRLQPLYETLRQKGGIRGAIAIGMGLGSYTSRTIGAIAGTMAVSALTGGSNVIGFAAAPMAAALGARFSPFLLAGGAIVGGAYLAGRAGYSVLKAGYDYRQQQKSIHTSGDLMAFNTNAALTMRARAVQAMQNSHMNARSALGQEAMFLHHPQRSYHAPFRAGY